MKPMTVEELEKVMRPVIQDGKVNDFENAMEQNAAMYAVAEKISGGQDEFSVDNYMHYYASLMMAEDFMETYLRAQADKLIPPSRRESIPITETNDMVIREYKAYIAEAEECHRREVIYGGASSVCNYWMRMKGYITSEYSTTGSLLDLIFRPKTTHEEDADSNENNTELQR